MLWLAGQTAITCWGRQVWDRIWNSGAPQDQPALGLASSSPVTTVSTRFGKPVTRTEPSATQPASRRCSSQPVSARSRRLAFQNQNPLQPSASRTTIAKRMRMP